MSPEQYTSRTYIAGDSVILATYCVTFTLSLVEVQTFKTAISLNHFEVVGAPSCRLTRPTIPPGPEQYTSYTHTAGDLGILAEYHIPRVLTLYDV